MTKKLYLPVFISLLLSLTGCKQDVDVTKLTPSLYDYAPINIGYSVIYDVDSIIFKYNTPTQTVDTIHYQLKELVSDTFYDNLGKLSYIIQLYRRPDSTQPFTIINRDYYSYISKGTYERVEDDMRFIKMVFPVVNGATWNGNSYLPANDTLADTYQQYSSWVYTYTSVNAPVTINGLHFDSAAVVSEVNNQNLITSEVSTATYARHVGMVYKQWELLNKQGVSSTWDAPDSVNGFRIKMWIHSYTP